MTFKPRSLQLSTSTLRPPQMQTSTSQVQPSSPQRSPLVPPVVHYPSYPSSTLHTYFPRPSSTHNFAHISNFLHHSSPVQYGPGMPLPSALQSHVLSIRGTPSSHSAQQPNLNNDPRTSPFVQYTSPLLSPLVFPQLFLSPTLNHPNSPYLLSPHSL